MPLPSRCVQSSNGLVKCAAVIEKEPPALARSAGKAGLAGKHGDMRRLH
jgi:hypothetical protein